MFNIMLDPLPEDWNGYPIDWDFRTGIQITQCLSDNALSDMEKRYTAISLLFPDENNRPSAVDAMEAVNWFLNDFNHDKHGKNTGTSKVMDFDVDQWRIYAAFKQQYGIDLNEVSLHWFVFMGLLSNLEECNFTNVIDIRQKKITPKMSREEKKAITEAKKVYVLGTAEKQLTSAEKEQDAEALAEFHKMLNRNR